MSAWFRRRAGALAIFVLLFVVWELAVRLLGNQRLQLLDQLSARAQLKFRGDPRLEREQSEFGEPLGLKAQGTVVADPCERLPAPKREGRPQALGGAARRPSRERLPALRHQPLEAAHVYLVRKDVRGIAGLAPQNLNGQHPSES